MTTAGTRLVALLGHPVAHSRSPAMMSAACECLGLEAVYVACDVRADALGDAIRGLAALGAAGANVTVPHKIAAVSFCDRLDAQAAAIGAVNTLRFADGCVIGHNTDADGAVDAFRAAGVSLSGARVVVLGSGGAARAVAVGLARAGVAHVAVRARRAHAAQAVVVAVTASGVHADADVLIARDPAVARADVIVQATSAGLDGAPDDDAVIAALDGARSGAFAMDVVYAPRETRWLAAARAGGLRPVDGLGMLAGQAARALSLWFDRAVAPDILRGFLDASGARE
ncbi:MAG: shikimate dehydrogenase [Deltaproteobacteria bacterium]